ncbi:MAG: hypothetical protein MJ193_01915, partial [Clostridia bacterium]|nr:hypothetical protein [Clostridia bacterium]
MKKRFCLLMLFVLSISIFASCLVACNEKNRLEEAYDNIMGSYNIIDKYSSSSDPTTNYIKLADDKS